MNYAMCTICNLLISLCVHMLCVCVRAPEPMLMMASSQLCESFSSQRIYSSAINGCSHFAFLLLQGYYCSLIPDALGVRAGRHLSHKEGSPTGIARAQR